MVISCCGGACCPEKMFLDELGNLTDLMQPEAYSPYPRQVSGHRHHTRNLITEQRTRRIPADFDFRNINGVLEPLGQHQVSLGK
jgi:hypothetical protein